MVLCLLPVGLDSGRRRLVVGNKLWLLPMARWARPSSTVSAGAATLLVASTSMPASLPSAYADPDTFRDAKSNTETSGTAHSHSHADTETSGAAHPHAYSQLQWDSRWRSSDAYPHSFSTRPWRKAERHRHSKIYRAHRWRKSDADAARFTRPWQLHAQDDIARQRNRDEHARQEKTDTDAKAVDQESGQRSSVSATISRSRPEDLPPARRQISAVSVFSFLPRHSPLVTFRC